MSAFRLSGTVFLLVVGATSLMSGCKNSYAPGDRAARVSMQDQCDPATFNAALGAGTCSRQGSVTLAQFNNELSTSHQVSEWRNVPATLTLRSGQTIVATNDGGEVHTFTRVAQFGGGIVPSLNSASNNPVEAPECQQLTVADRLAPGTSSTTYAANYSGTAYYQCCIHPWMRTTVTVQ